MDLNDGSVRTVIWATGYRPDYSWLDVPVLDRKGRIRHNGGVAEAPGMYVMGLPFMRRRKSSSSMELRTMPRILPRTLPSACVAWPPDGAVKMNTPYHFQHFQPHYDAVIVGARCAGAATAMLLARAGMKVLVIDRQAYGSDTMSTHALMRTGVLQLERWGLLPAVMAGGTPEIRATTFHYGCEFAEPKHQARAWHRAPLCAQADRAGSHPRRCSPQRGC